jgi:hypothetical protein
MKKRRFAKSGSRIRCFFDPLDPGSMMAKIRIQDLGINIPAHISELSNSFLGGLWG